MKNRAMTGVKEPPSISNRTSKSPALLLKLFTVMAILFGSILPQNPAMGPYQLSQGSANSLPINKRRSIRLSNASTHQMSPNNQTRGLIPTSEVNVWYCSNNPGTGIEIYSVDIEDYPIQKGVTAYYEFQGIGLANFRMGGAVIILSIPATGAQVMQASTGDPYIVHQGYWIDYWFGFQFPSYVPPGTYNVNILFIDVYGNVRECIYFPARF